MRFQILSGVGILMVVIPSLLMGVSYADQGTWPGLRDLRWFLILVGLIFLLASNVLHRRGAAEGAE